MPIGFDSMGREIPDPTPVEIPVGFHRPPSLREQFARFMREELSARAVDAGMESFEEADDFDVPDDPPDPASPWELNFDQMSTPTRSGEPVGKSEPAGPSTAAPAVGGDLSTGAGEGTRPSSAPAA